MSGEVDWVIRSRRVLAGGAPAPATVHVRGERIARVSAYDDVADAGAVVDVGDDVVMPGIVDTHVHVNEPGRTEWEGFETATCAAAAGGVTTLVDMPLNSIPAATSARAVATKAEATEGRCYVDVGLWGGAVPANAGHLRPLLAEGALGFKCFLIDSGVDEFPYVKTPDVRAAMTELRDTGAVLMVHAELPDPVEAARVARAADAARRRDPRSYLEFLASRPREAEDTAVALLMALCREIRTPVHVVHLSSSGALASLRRARDEGLPLTAETAPHYLYFDAEEVPDGATQFKCVPPIRERENREALWAGLREGLIEMVVSDHSPCVPDLKRLDTGNFDDAWGGIASLQFGLSVVWTEARARGFALADVSRWMSAAPARHAGLAGRKGALAAGCDADLVVFDPEGSYRVEPGAIRHRHKVTPYAGRTLDGVVRATYLRGRKVYDAAAGVAARPGGRWLRRGA
jgi:allantoinase